MFSKNPDSSGIYKIICTPTGKIYIGSAINLRNRWNEHLKGLRHNAHGNSKLQRAWNKYGEEAFVFEVLELVLFPDLLTAREQYWFNKMQPFDEKGFNLARVAGSSLGRKYSQATLEKMSNSHRGQPSAFRGRKHSPESLEEMSNSHRGRVPPNRGQHYSPEIRERMRSAAANRMKTLIFTDPDGTEYTVTGIGQFCKEHHLIKHHIMEVANGECKQHHGWTARYPEADAV